MKSRYDIKEICRTVWAKSLIEGGRKLYIALRGTVETGLYVYDVLYVDAGWIIDAIQHTRSSSPIVQ